MCFLLFLVIDWYFRTEIKLLSHPPGANSLSFSAKLDLAASSILPNWPASGPGYETTASPLLSANGMRTRPMPLLQPSIRVNEATPPEVTGSALVSATSRLAFTYMSASMYSLDKIKVSTIYFFFVL